tara:strand:- start:3934 stop:5187 length:1254 start_codon:yes stop_codon:yes gene_type:complete
VAYLKQGQEALLSMFGKPPGSKPEYRGAGPNRNEFSFMRYKPEKLSPRLEKSLSALRDKNNPMRQDMLRSINAGLEVGEDWYNSEELLDWFTTGYGPDEGLRQYHEFLDLIGAASPGSKVIPNIGNATAIREKLYTDPTYADKARNVFTDAEGRALAKERAPKYGHKTAGNQEMIVGRQLRGEFAGMPQPGVAPTKSSMVENPKPKGFTASLKGSEKNIAADLHFTRYFGMASKDPDWLATGGTEVGEAFMQDLIKKYPKVKKYFKVNKNGKPGFNPKAAVVDGVIPIEEMEKSSNVWAQMPRDREYGAMEDFMFELGQELGLTGPQVQASLWMGAARRTGVDPTSQTTFMGAMRDRAATTAAKRGTTPEQVLFDMIMNKRAMSVPFGAGGVMGALGMQQPQPGTPESPLYYNMRAQ